MRFDFSSLLKAEQNKTQLGNWGGCPVYAMGKNGLEKNSRFETMYVVYDDGNALVEKVGPDLWAVRGYVNESGNVRETRGHTPYELPKKVDMTTRRKYTYTSSEEKKEVKENEKKSTSSVVADEKMINDYLNQMNELTIEEMLKGVRGME